MRRVPYEQAHEIVEGLASSPGSWAILVAPPGTREEHLGLLVGRFFGAEWLRPSDVDPAPLAAASERDLLRIVRGAAADGKVAVFVTDDAGWDPSSLQGPERHTLTHVTIEGYVMPTDRRRPRRAIEDQDGIVAWTAEHYPEERGDLRKKLLNLMEETAELVVELGHDPKEMADWFMRSAARPPSGHPHSDIRGAAGEVGDVGIALVDVADVVGLRALGCRTAKMEVNALKDPEDSRARSARKRGLGL